MSNKKFKINGKEFKLIDYKSQFTYKMLRLAKKELAPMLANVDLNNISISELMQFDLIVILPLILYYVDEDINNFSDEIYKEKKEFFENCPLKEIEKLVNIEDEIQNFFLFIMGSIGKSFQMFFKQAEASTQI